MCVCVFFPLKNGKFTFFARPYFHVLVVRALICANIYFFYLIA